MYSVLLIDDSKTFQRILGMMVKDRLTVVGTAGNGNEGFEKYKELKPDWVLLDITMPNCSGIECLQKIIQHDPHAKVIMISGIGDTETAKECMRLGAKAFISKELVTSSQRSKNDNELIVKLDELLNERILGAG